MLLCRQNTLKTIWKDNVLQNFKWFLKGARKYHGSDIQFFFGIKSSFEPFMPGFLGVYRHPTLWMHIRIFLVQRVSLWFLFWSNIADINVHLRCRRHNLVSFSKPAPLRHYLNYNISMKTIRFEYTLSGVSHLTATFCAPHANGWGPHPAASWLLDLN